MPNHVQTFLRRNAVNPASASVGGAPSQSNTASPMLAAIDTASQGEARRRELLSQARQRTRIAVGKMHAAIGEVLANSAGLIALNPFHILGLTQHMADIVSDEVALAALEARGREHYAARYARGVTLTMLGVSEAKPAPEGEPTLSERLREAGFAGAGHSWAGTVSIPMAVELAQRFELTLLRYDSDHNPTFYVRKGVTQPALTELMSEHRALVDHANGSPANSKDATFLGKPEMVSSDETPEAVLASREFSVAAENPLDGPKTKQTSDGANAQNASAKPSFSRAFRQNGEHQAKN